MSLTGDEVIARLVANEDRFDKFINTAEGYTTSTGGSVPGLVTAPTTTAGITHTSIVSGVPQSLKDKVDQTVSLKDFGDAGAGSWSTIFNDALDKCLDAGVGTLELHGGVININTQVTATAPGVCSLNIIGPGIEECRLVSGVTGDTLDLNHAGYAIVLDGLRNSVFSGFTLDYSVQTNATSAGRGGIACLCRAQSFYHNLFEGLQFIGGTVLDHRELTNRMGLKFVGNELAGNSNDYATYFNSVRWSRFNYAHTHVGVGIGDNVVSKNHQPNANFVSDGNLFERYIIAVDAGDCDEWEISGDGMFFQQARGPYRIQAGTIAAGASTITVTWNMNTALAPTVSFWNVETGKWVVQTGATCSGVNTIQLSGAVTETTSYQVVASYADVNDGYTDCVYANGMYIRLKYTCEPGGSSRPFALGAAADLVLHDINNNAALNPYIPDDTKRIVGVSYRGLTGIAEINRLQAKDIHIFGSATAGTSHSGTTARLVKVYHKGTLAEYIGIGFDNTTGIAKVQAINKDIDLRPTNNKQNILTGGSWQSPVRLGDFRVWFTSGGALYKKSGADPTSDTDGTAI